MVGSRGVPPHSPHNESLSGQSRTDVATDHKKTGAVASFATRASLSILEETWPASRSNQLWRPRLFSVPSQSIHQRRRLHRLVPLQTHNRHNQHPQLLQSMSRKRPFPHRKHQTRCHGQRRSAAIRLSHNLASRVVLIPHEYVPSQSHGDGHGGNDTSATYGCGSSSGRM